MKQLFQLTLIVIVALIIGCGGTSNKQPDGGNTDMIPDNRTVGIEVNPAKLVSYKDMVCGMSVKNIPIADTAHYKGRVYPFCAKECKAAFKANPTKFAAN